MDLLTITSFSSNLISSGRAMFKSSMLKIVGLENTPESIIMMAIGMKDYKMIYILS